VPAKSIHLVNSIHIDIMEREVFVLLEEYYGSPQISKAIRSADQVNIHRNGKWFEIKCGEIVFVKGNFGIVTKLFTHTLNNTDSDFAIIEKYVNLREESGFHYVISEVKQTILSRALDLHCIITCNVEERCYFIK
jgi:hypothetical protein